MADNVHANWNVVTKICGDGDTSSLMVDCDPMCLFHRTASLDKVGQKWHTQRRP